MENSCKNCGNIVKKNYCDVCGQASNTKRLNFSYLVSQLQSVFNIDKGLFYTIKELFIKPGNTIHNYLEGKRVPYFKPFSFVFVIATVYALIAYIWGDTLVNTMSTGILDSISDNNEFGANAHNYHQIATNFLYSYYGVFALLLIPLYALGTYWLFKKEQYNYVEHLAINAYIIGIQIFICIFSLIFSAIYVGAVIYIFSMLITVWMYLDVFIKTPKGIRIFKALASIFFPMVSIIIAAYVIGLIIGIIYAKLSGYYPVI